MPLQAGAQLILQSQRPDHSFDCIGFLGIPVVNPVFLALASADTKIAQSDLENLQDDLVAELARLSHNVQQIPVPCNGIVPDPSVCHAHGEADCQKLLIVVGDVIKARSH